MNDSLPTVFVVDDDLSIQKALKTLIRSVGLQVEVFGSAEEFLRYNRPNAPCCLVLDVRLPGISGLDFHKQLLKENIFVPVIFITGHGDIPMSVRTMKSGAVDFLAKPFRDQDLLDAIHAALQRDRERRQHATEVAELRERLDSLTAREQEVFRLLLCEHPNKQIAALIGTSENTVKIHRSNIMRKMQVQSLVQLFRMAEKLGIAAR